MYTVRVTFQHPLQVETLAQAIDIVIAAVFDDNMSVFVYDSAYEECNIPAAISIHCIDPEPRWFINEGEPEWLQEMYDDIPM